MEKSCTKYAPKAIPRPLFLINNPKQSLHPRNYFKIRYTEKGLSNALKKVNFIFSFEPSPF